MERLERGFKKAVEGKGEFGEECKTVARKAAGMMVAIEESLAFYCVDG